ncbi:AmmeMemoRadiSam system protein B, partial [Candidatus Woesearchaeota archaeon]|nr:AmmeMemoRadiSam system protein B [Candidatus Woesearchaeota archaeon]
MTRKPIAIGMFYEELFELLDRQISECFTHKLGPGALPSKRTENKLIGIIAPHAGYQMSGPCQAWAYKEIAESEFPDIFIILGANHQAKGKAATLLDDFET